MKIVQTTGRVQDLYRHLTVTCSAAMIFVLSFLSGCGYTLSGSTLPSHIKAIHVEHFKNKIEFGTERKRNIYFPLLEVDVRNEIMERFLFDGTLMVAEEGEGDYILKGELKNYERSGLRFTDDDNVQEYRVHVIMRLELWDSQGNLIWEEPNFTGEATFFISGPQATSEASAVEEAVKDLAKRVVERTIENW